VKTSLLLLLALCGCDPVVERQSLVVEFHTTEVSCIGNSEYVIRDTNGAVWYVRRSGTKLNSTMLFNSPK
jgi:hypothetical protein